MNHHARALGRLGKGRKKTMTPEAIRQRQEAAKQRKHFRCQSDGNGEKKVVNNLHKTIDKTETLP